MAVLIDPETVAFLETGCALLVGTTDPDGAPVATRGWGCRVVEQATGRARLRVVLAADDPRGVEHGVVGDRVAVTATSVRTLRSVQLKGRVVAMEPATAADDEVAEAYCEAFFTDITETDGTPRAVLERMRPVGHLVWVTELDEVYDQTPGPAAGRALPAAR